MLPARLQHHATTAPGKAALLYADQSLSYADLQSQVTTFAAALHSHGIAPGDHVALWLPNSPAFVVAFYAVLTTGAIVTPLNPASKQGDLNVPPQGFKLILTTPDLHPSLTAAIADHPTIPIQPIDPANPQLETSPQSDSTPLQAPSPSSPSLLAFSSGSTGKPKALYRTGAQLQAEAQHFQSTCATTPADTFLCTIPLFHAHGLGNALVASIHAGATLVILPRPAPFGLYRAAALELLQEHHITIFPTVPLQIDALAELPGTGNLPHLRLCFTAGSPLKPTTAQNFHTRFATHVRQLYGCTEAGSVTIDRSDPPTPASVGTPMHDIDLEIVDPSGANCPPDTPGEIRFRSPALTDGYTNATPDTINAFQDGWFHTGDNGYLDDHGQLHVTGRKHFVVEIAGNKVYLPELEEILTQAPGVKEIALTSDTTTSTTTLIAHIVPASDFDPESFKSFTQKTLPHHKRPQTIKILTSLPRTPLGKLARDQLT